MRERQVQETRLERFYAVAMHLYPPRFREAFAPAMRQAINDALNDRTLSRRTLVLVILKDLVVSLAKEHIAMLRDTFGRPGLVFNAVILAALATGLALALYTIPQQLLRLGASLPLDGAGRLRGDVVDHAVDAAHLVHDAAGDALEHLVGQRRPVGGHAVFGMHGAHRAGVGIGALVAHYAHAHHRQQHGKALPDLCCRARRP
jgi:hypothetical protein